MTENQNGGSDTDRVPAVREEPQVKVSVFVREAASAIATLYLATHSVPAVVATAVVVAVVALGNKTGRQP